MLQNQANGSHENDGRSGGKGGFGIESRGDRQEENNFNGEGITIGLDNGKSAQLPRLEKTYFFMITSLTPF